MLQEAQLFNWLKKNKSIEPTMAQPERGETAPFEILLPDDLMNSGVPDLRIASKFLALLVESELPMQHLEIHHDMPLVNSPYQPIKQFLSTINGAKQLQKFLEQVEFMLFKARNPSAKGSLCCLINGVFTEFEISERAKNATINWCISRCISQKHNK
jgi:hypothetical protein